MIIMFKSEAEKKKKNINKPFGLYLYGFVKLTELHFSSGRIENNSSLYNCKRIEIELG
jgi:hypothetical protein